jgi:opacity protein-like surface antigen
MKNLLSLGTLIIAVSIAAVAATYARWSGTKLKGGAQTSVDALKKAGKGLKAGAKQVDSWFKDIGNGIKDVGRKL